MFNIFKKDKKLFTLFVPIFLEVFLLMLAGIVDTLMLSGVSDEAVGAVGSANTYLGLFAIVFTIIASGLIAVMTQYIGAGKKGIAYQARQIALLLNGVFGFVISLFLWFGGSLIIDGLGMADNLREDAVIYTRIVGASCMLLSITPVFSSYLRAFDKTKHSLCAALIGNGFNVLFNALFIFVWKQGVLGVAIATIIGRAVQLTLNVIFSIFLVNGRQYKERIDNKLLIKQIVKIGLPAALESALYTVAMVLVTMFLNMMDETGFNATARTYANQITSFAYCAALAFAQANVILNGWRIGEDRVKDCYSSTNKSALIGIGSGVLIELIISLCSFWIMQLFTDDQTLVKAVQLILLVDIALEIGRAGNLVYGQALKGAGDSFYPAIVAIIFNFICAVGLTYLFGIVFKLGVLGAYIGLTLDECLRALFMFIRYRSGKWESKVIIKRNKEEKKRAEIIENA